MLYDVSSAAFEGRTWVLDAIAFARDGVRRRLQIVYRALTTAEVLPVAVEVFKGNTGDPATLASQVKKLRPRAWSLPAVTRAAWSPCRLSRT